MKLDVSDKFLLSFFLQSNEKKLGLDEYVNDLLAQLSQRIVEQPDFEIKISDKVGLAKYIISRSIDEYGLDDLSIAWTGGKDSTLLLWLLKETLKKKASWPKIMFIDEGNVFEEVENFSNELAEKWKFDYEVIQNKDVMKQVEEVGDTVRVSKLNQRNKNELKRLGFKEKEFVFEPESMEGNHLMKTVAQNEYIEKTKTKALVTGIRWDEQEARSEESYFSRRGDAETPEHMRIHPILHFTEADVWQATLDYKIPYCSLYEEGYRSLGAKGTTSKVSSTPAWEQDLENTTEREGRAQDKEEIMKRLRDLGYM